MPRLFTMRHICLNVKLNRAFINIFTIIILLRNIEVNIIALFK